MAELTPHLIEGLMSNIPPQQDFRRAVTIRQRGVSDRGTGIPIRCPIGSLLPNIARVRVRISNHPHQR